MLVVFQLQFILLINAGVYLIGLCISKPPKSQTTSRPQDTPAELIFYKIINSPILQWTKGKIGHARSDHRFIFVFDKPINVIFKCTSLHNKNWNRFMSFR